MRQRVWCAPACLAHYARHRRSRTSPRRKHQSSTCRSLCATLPRFRRERAEIQARASEFAFVHTAYDDSDRAFERITQVERPRVLGVAQIANGFDGEPHYRGILADDGRLVVILFF